MHFFRKVAASMVCVVCDFIVARGHFRHHIAFCLVQLTIANQAPDWHFKFRKWVSKILIFENGLQKLYYNLA